MSAVPFDTLPTDEQIQHVQDLWDRIAARPHSVVVPEEQLVEIRRRRDLHQADPGRAVDLEQARRLLRSRE